MSKTIIFGPILDDFGAILTTSTIVTPYLLSTMTCKTTWKMGYFDTILTLNKAI
jgi:hypothetical protein